MFGFRLFSRHRLRLLFLFVGIVLVGAAWLTFTALAETVTTKVDRDLARHWRTSYDLLVRAPDSVLPVEKEAGRVRVNYLADLRPAITWEQYQAIRRIPGVEVAAPISMLGYVALYVHGVESAPGPGLYRYKLHIQVDNGVQQGTVYQAETYQWFFPSAQEDLFVQAGLWDRRWDALHSPSNSAVTPAPRSTPPSFSARPTTRTPVAFGRQFRVPMLLAAIDPEAEAQLVGLDKAVTKGMYLTAEMPSCRYAIPGHGETLMLPVLVQQGLYTRITVQERVDALRMPSLPAPTLIQRFTKDPGALRALPVEKNILDKTFPGAQDYLAEWKKALGMADFRLIKQVARGNCNPFPEGVPTPSSGGALAAFALPALPAGPLWPLPSAVRYRVLGKRALEAIPWPDEQVHMPAGFATDFPPQPPEPFFRQPPAEPLAHTILLPMGFYDVGQLKVSPDALTTVPLETYAPPTLPLRTLNGKPVAGKRVLLPSLSPLGYLQSPPVLLTNLRAACEFLLPHQPCISAIRVRVAGTERFTPEAQERLEAVAAEIIRQTGLAVDVVTGSSPTEVNVRLPGEGKQPDVTVAEPWVQKGVHLTIQRRTHWSDRLLGLTLWLLATVYIVSLLQDTVEAQSTFLGVCKAVGWRSRTLFGQVVLWAFGLGLVGGGAAALLAWLAAYGGGWQVPSWRLAVIPWLSAAMTAIGALLPAWKAARVPPLRVLRPEVKPSPLKVRGSAIMRLLLRQVRRAWGGWVVLAVTAFLLSAGVGALRSNAGYLALTFLGRYVMVHIERYHRYLLGGLLLIGGLGTADWLWVALERERVWLGLLKGVGWRDRALFGLWMGKALLIGLSAGVVGGLLGVVAAWALVGWDTRAYLLGFTVGWALPTAAALVAAYFPARRAARIPPAQVLRGE